MELISDVSLKDVTISDLEEYYKVQVELFFRIIPGSHRETKNPNGGVRGQENCKTIGGAG